MRVHTRVSSTLRCFGQTKMRVDESWPADQLNARAYKGLGTNFSVNKACEYFSTLMTGQTCTNSYQLSSKFELVQS